MKRQHPIRKMSREVWGRDNWAFLDDDEKRLSDKKLARAVKPLLDVGIGKIPHLYAGLCYDSAFPENAGDPKCPACRLLADWLRRDREGR